MCGVSQSNDVVHFITSYRLEINHTPSDAVQTVTVVDHQTIICDRMFIFKNWQAFLILSKKVHITNAKL